MAKIQGITIEVGGDTTNLQKSLKNVNGSIEKTQKELKEVERLLKLDPKNTEVVAQQQKLLGKAIEDTKSKLETLREAEKQVQKQFEKGEVSEEQYRAIKREVIWTEQELKKLNARQDKANGIMSESERAYKQAKEAAEAKAKADEEAAKKSQELSDEVEIAEKQLELEKLELEKNTKALGANQSQQETLEKVRESTNKQIDIQKSKISSLNKQLDELTNSEEKNEKAILDKKAEIIRAEKELDNYERSLLDVNSQIKSLGKEHEKLKDKIKKSGQAIQDFGSKVSSAGEAMTPISVGAAGILTGLVANVEATRDYREEMGKLETAFKTSGHSIEDAEKVYKDFNAILGESDRSVEAVNHLAKLTTTQEELAQWTDIATGVYATFGDSLPIEGLTEAANETAKVGDLTGVLADALNWAGINEDDFQAKLDATNSEKERAQLITETLNGLYAETAEKYREVNAETIRANEIQEEMAETMAELGEIMQPIINEIMTELNEKISQVIEWFKKFDEETIKMILSILALVAGLAPALLIIGQLITAVGTITKVIGLLNVPILLVVGAIAALVAGFVYLWQTNEEFRDKIIEIWEYIKTFLQEAFEKIKEISKKALDKIKAFWEENGEEIKEKVSEIFKRVSEIFKQAFEGIREVVKVALEVIKEFWDRHGAKIQEVVSKLFELIKIIFENYLKMIQENVSIFISVVKKFWELFGEDITAIVKSLWEAVNKIFSAALDILAGLLDVVIGLFTGDFERMKEGVVKIFKGMWDMVVAQITLAWEMLSIAFSGLWEKISKWFTDLKDSATQWGKDLINGFTNGIKDTISSAVNVAGEMASSVSNTIKSFFGIASPSKLMYSFGQFIDEGLANGIESKSGTVKEQAELVAQVVGNALTSVQETVNQTVAVIQKEFELWQLSNQGLAGSSEELNQKLQMQEEQQKALTEELKVTELALEKIGNTYGYASEEAMKYREKLLDIKIEQQELTNSIADTSKEIENMRTQMSKVNYSYTGKSSGGSSKGSLAYSLYVGNSGGTSGKYSASQEAYEAGRDILAREIAMREGVDMSVGKSMADQQMRENAKAIEQNITINSPKALSPSEAAKEFKKASQKLALEY